MLEVLQLLVGVDRIFLEFWLHAQNFNKTVTLSFPM